MIFAWQPRGSPRLFYLEPLEPRNLLSTAYRIEDLGMLGGQWTAPMNINDQGEVVGYSETEQGQDKAFVWSAKSGMRQLGGITADQSNASGINNRGDIIAEVSDPTNGY